MKRPVAEKRSRRSDDDNTTAQQPAHDFVPVRGAASTRVFVHLLLNFLHRTDRERRVIYGEDLDLAMVAETVGIAALEAEMRDPTFRDAFRDYDKVVGSERQRPINALSVAESTGIPRETVRRKLKTLVEKGALVRKGSGYIYQPGFAQQPQHQAAFERGIRDMLQFVNDCLNQGVLQLVPKPTAKGQPAKLKQ